MRRRRSLLHVACASFWAASAAIACSDGDTSRPAELGNCVPIGDAGCKSAVGGGGSPTGPSGEDSGQGGESEGGTAECGTAATLLSAPNNTCETCIQANCCQAFEACTGSCLQFLQCMASCASISPPSATCVSACGSPAEGSSVLNGYEDFASCLLNEQCTPQCPTLPMPSTGDI